MIWSGENKCIIVFLRVKKDIFLIDEDCHENFIPYYFCSAFGFYLPPYLKLIASYCRISKKFLN